MADKIERDIKRGSDPSNSCGCLLEKLNIQCLGEAEHVGEIFSWIVSSGKLFI